MPMTPTLRPPTLMIGVGRGRCRPSLGCVGSVGIGERVVGGEDGEAAELLVLLLEVDRALVELVVAERHRRQAELRHGAHLDLAVELVEHRRAFEDVARVEVQRARRRRADERLAASARTAARS